MQRAGPWAGGIDERLGRDFTRLGLRRGDTVKSGAQTADFDAEFESNARAAMAASA